MGIPEVVEQFLEFLLAQSLIKTCSPNAYCGTEVYRMRIPEIVEQLLEFLLAQPLIMSLRWVLSVLATLMWVSICTFIAFSWISHVLCLRESRTLMVDKGTDIVLRRSARSGEHPDFLSAMKNR